MQIRDIIAELQRHDPTADLAVRIEPDDIPHLFSVVGEVEGHRIYQRGLDFTHLEVASVEAMGGPVKFRARLILTPEA